MKSKEIFRRIAKVYIACLIGALALFAAILVLYGTEDFQAKLNAAIIVFACIALFINLCDILYWIKKRSRH